MRQAASAVVFGLIFAPLVHAAGGGGAADLWPQLESVYTDLHAHPELSFQETVTASKMADRLKALGFEVTTGVGKTGVVGVLKNGAGPTVMIRTELDGLPVEEKTGLPFASKATAKNAAGDPVSVMHACGHDVHMTAWLGTATLLARDTASWHGTLIMLAQPAEEIGAGAKAMLADGLLTRFPRPDAAIAVHDTESLPSGTIGILPGPVMASADSVDVSFFGRGGHGARAYMTIDPIVMASKFVVDLQTLVSRETDPFQPAVVTVGSFHAGTKHNIIPDSAHLRLTVRAYTKEVRQQLLDGIKRIANAQAEAAKAPKPPEFAISDSVPVTVNDPALSTRVEAALRKALGDARVVPMLKSTGAEDYSYFADAGIPALMMQIGATPAAALAESQKSGVPVPGLHSAIFAPDAKPTITAGIEALTVAARELFSTKK